MITNTEKSFVIVVYCPLSAKLTMERSFDYNIGIERKVSHSGVAPQFSRLWTNQLSIYRWVEVGQVEEGWISSFLVFSSLVSIILSLSLCLRKRDFNILDNVFIAFHQSNSK
jgi:hypothetical protein